MQRVPKNQDLADHKELERKIDEEVAKNVREILEKAQLRPVDEPRAGRSTKRRRENTDKNGDTSSTQSESSSSQAAGCSFVDSESRNDSETPAFSDDDGDSYNGEDYPSFMEVDIGDEYYDMGCAMDLFGDKENVERKEMSPTTASGPPAQEPKKRKNSKPKKAPCPHCGRELSSATAVKRHLNSCKVLKMGSFQAESPAQGKKKRRTPKWKPEKVPCPKCGKVMYSKHTLKPHLEICKAASFPISHN
ncbi:hypothetical protein B9Z55_022451 [Caenorhabditis nigoni]|uniref:Uncharacterized protein n=1 Tax=Caenorhabditis nigoni TaxID=1611254 RepID=A0A2G5SKP7_9PELO|nr:hypothetical protein B9Z55_022451 [Caenorhabditis nigoni]